MGCYLLLVVHCFSFLSNNHNQHHQKRVGLTECLFCFRLFSHYESYVRSIVEWVVWSFYVRVQHSLFLLVALIYTAV